jgi:4-carboxymuconolactone decarboxylase
MTLIHEPSTAATIGRNAMNEAAPGVPDMVDASLAALSPRTARRVYEQIWGDIYQDPSLSLRDRTLATIAGLTVLGGAEANLALQINIALSAGMTPVEIVAVIEHAATIAGFSPHDCCRCLRPTWYRPQGHVMNSMRSEQR